MSVLYQVATPTLDIAYERSGPDNGLPVILLHGYPYDVRAYDAVVPLLNAAGHSTIVPYLRGYGQTRIRAGKVGRSGEQAALGHDLLELMDALRIEKAVLAGFDWGARSACVLAALWPERAHGIVTCGGYQIQDIARAVQPIDPEQEARYWYQFYFHTERGRRALGESNTSLTRTLWKMWSPTWAFDEATFQRSVPSFDNPDFVDVVVHSYQHRLGLAPGFAQYAATESRLSKLPRIAVPTIVLHGDADGVVPAATSAGHAKFFTGRYERRVLAGIGHNPPAEAPSQFADAVLALTRG
jgi:pimeloyl-ACP methyl ester carboxylesterase